VGEDLASLGPASSSGDVDRNNKPRSATATCPEAAKQHVIDANTFEAMIRSNAEIAVRMIKKLSDRLAEADDQIENLLFADASSRVVHFLATAAEKVPKGAGGHEILVVPRELPGRVGVKPEQVDEVVGKLLKSRIVLVQPDRFVVPDVAKLRHFLEFLQMKAQFEDAT
jgi:CRP-like cAMP-binding protein